MPRGSVSAERIPTFPRGGETISKLGGTTTFSSSSAISNLFVFPCLFSRHAQRKYDHRDVQRESNSDDNAWGILQLLAWMLVHKFRQAAVGILQVISEMVMLLALFLFFFPILLLFYRLQPCSCPYVLPAQGAMCIFSSVMRWGSSQGCRDSADGDGSQSFHTRSTLPQ